MTNEQAEIKGQKQDLVVNTAALKCLSGLGGADWQVGVFKLLLAADVGNCKNYAENQLTDFTILCWFSSHAKVMLVFGYFALIVVVGGDRFVC